MISAARAAVLHLDKQTDVCSPGCGSRFPVPRPPQPRASEPQSARERVLDFVRRRLHEGFPPTVREVQRELGFRAVQSAQQHLEALVAEGRLVRSAGKARGCRLPESAGGGPALLVPLLGRVQAGALTEAVEDVDGHILVEARRSKVAGTTAKTRPGELFALRVRGESMSGAGILDGDIVVVRRQASAQSGDIVVALVGDEATVKRLRLRPGRVELWPENPRFEPIVIRPPEEVSLLGRVIELRRHLDGFRRASSHPDGFRRGPRG